MLDNNHWLIVSASFNLERPVSHVLLDDGVSELSSDESLGIEDSIVGIFGYLVLGGISNEPLGLCEGNIGWGGPVSLIVGDDLNSVILPHSHTGVGSAQVDSNGFV